MCVVGFLLALKSFHLIFFTYSCRIVYEVTLSMLLLSTIIFSLKWQFQMRIKNSQKTAKRNSSQSTHHPQNCLPSILGECSERKESILVFFFNSACSAHILWKWANNFRTSIDIQKNHKHVLYSTRQHMAFTSEASELQWQVVRLHPFWTNPTLWAERFPLTNVNDKLT